MIKVHFGEPLVERSQDPDDRLDWGVSWATFLEEGETIDDSDWSVSPDDGATLEEDDVTSGGTATVVWVKELTAAVATITNRIVTTGGRQKDFSFKLKKREH